VADACCGLGGAALVANGLPYRMDMSDDAGDVLVFPSRSASRLLRLLFTASGLKVWGALVGILTLTAFLPGAAKLQAALVLALGLTAAVLARLRDPALEAVVQSRRWADPSQAIRFDGVLGRIEGRGRTRWRRVRCLLDGSDLVTTAYSRQHHDPAKTSIGGSRVLAVTSSLAADGVKGGSFRIIHLQLADGSRLMLAVDPFAVAAIEGALKAHA
jgi:hypothetical protein